MLKRMALAALAVAVAGPAFAQGNPRGEAKATVAGKAVSIDYGRPSLKGRDMLGQAQVGQAWRMGADEATTLKTEADLSFGPAAVPRGEYVLKATKVEPDKWTLNVTSKDGAKVADIPLAPAKAEGTAEMFTVDLKGEKDKGEFRMQWGTTALKADFTGK